MSTHANILDSGEQIRELLRSTHNIAVLGIKTEMQASQPSFYVPQYLQSVGFEVIPVPVYFPEATHILGCPVYRQLADIPTVIDLVNIFRRPQDIAAHVEDILAAKPKAVWLQSGIRHDEVAQQLAAAGIQVVQDRCIMVEHRRLFR